MSLITLLTITASTITPIVAPSILPTNVPIVTPLVPLVIPSTHTVKPNIRTLKSAVVTQIIDGDTIKVVMNGKAVKIRFGCIDAPETTQPLAKEATVLLTSLIFNKNVQISTNGRLDMYGRTVGSVYLNDKPVSPILVRSGLALFNSVYKSSCSDLADIVEAENAAKYDKLGYWSLVNPVTPWDFKKQKYRPQTFLQALP